MLKQIARGLVSALSDPWVQGIFGLMLLARATDGMTRQLSELQTSIQVTQQMGSKVYMDWTTQQRDAKQPNPDPDPGDGPDTTYKPVTEYSSHDAHSER